MERLTNEVFAFNGTSCMQIKACGNDTCDETCRNRTGNEGCKGCPIQIAIDKLAEYEDFEGIFRSKMTDAACELLSDKEEFAKWLDRNKWIAKKCDEYARAEEQGKLLKLPCAVGDTVYVKMQFGGYAEAEVRDFTYFLTCGFCIVVTSDKFGKQNIPFSEFGKTVFLTKEEAEAALKEL